MHASIIAIGSQLYYKITSHVYEYLLTYFNPFAK